MAWLAQSWTLLVALIVLFAAGMPAARATGLRGLGQWAFAPVASTAMVVLLAIVYPLARIPWNGLTAAVGLIALVVLCLLAARLLRVPAARTTVRDGRGLLALGLAGGVAGGAARVVAYIGDPESVSQSNDAPFHLGAVRAILEQGTATPFGLGGLVDPEAPGAFYPGAWHAVTSLVAAYSGADIPVATNVMTVVVAAVVWPLGAAWLAHAATGRRLAAAAAAALSPALIAFPLLLVQYGILYSYLLAVALVPAALAALIVLSARSDDARPGRIVARSVAAAMGLLALATAQPSVILAWALLTLLYSAGRFRSSWPGLSRRERIAGTAGVILAAGGLAVLWWRMSLLVTADYWGAVRTPAQAALDLASGGYAGTPTAWAVSALALIGAAVSVRRRSTAWLTVAWLALALLYGVAASLDTQLLRLPLVGAWYGDTYRLAALLPLLTVPLAAVGVVALVDLSARLLPSARTATRALPWAAVLLILALGATAVALQPVVQRHHVANGVTETQSRFVSDASTWLSPDERTLLERLAQTVATGERIIGNPGTGAAFGYALSGADVYPAKWQVPLAPAYGVLAQGLRDASSEPAVCDAVAALDVAYVLDFGAGDRGTGRVRMPGLTGFAGQSGFELVDSEGSASLWRVTACAG